VAGAIDQLDPAPWDASIRDYLSKSQLRACDSSRAILIGP
jgi:hypothetical protein